MSPEFLSSNHPLSGVLLTFSKYYNIKTKQVNKIECIIYLASYTVLLMKKIAPLYPLLISIFTIFVAILAYLQEISFLDLMELKTIDL